MSQDIREFESHTLRQPCPRTAGDGTRMSCVTAGLVQNGCVNYGDQLRSALDQGVPLGKAMEILRGSGASPLEAACAVQDATGASAEEARELVAQSRAWAGPRCGVRQAGKARDWDGTVGQHGRSGHGASSVLPHLWRPAPRATSRTSR